MSVIRIDDDGTINCGPIKEDMTPCQFWGVWQLNACCGDCPLVQFADQYEEIKYGDVF